MLTSPKENRRFAYSSVYMEMDKDRAISKVTFHLIGGLESGDTDIGSTDCTLLSYQLITNLIRISDKSKDAEGPIDVDN